MSIKEIAKLAGVSTATVSRVLNGSDKVRESTASKVMEVVEQMNYRLDHVARRMKVKSTDSLVIGLIITDIGNPFFSNVAKGVEDVDRKSTRSEERRVGKEWGSVEAREGVRKE